MKNQETTNLEIQLLTELLYKRFNGQIRLNKKQTAHILGISVSTLDRNRYTLLPFFQENDTSAVLYSIYDIAKYLVEKKVKTL